MKGTANIVSTMTDPLSDLPKRRKAVRNFDITV